MANMSLDTTNAKGALTGERYIESLRDGREVWLDGERVVLQAVRAGHVLVANAPGSAFLESPALLGFFPALCERLLGDVLQLPSLDTWWCGERAVLPTVLPELERTVIKPTYSTLPHQGGFEAVLARDLTTPQRQEWASRIQTDPDRYTLQFHTAASQMPTWTSGSRGLASRPVILRVFAMRDGPNSWRILPGGLARLVGANAQVASMQRGGSSADVWIQTDDEVEPLGVAKLLAKVQEEEGAGLIILGKQAIDDDSNQTGQMLAALLNLPQGTFASKVEVEGDKVSVTREVDGGLETVKLSTPAIVTTDLRLNEPRYASLPNIMKAKSKPMATKTAADYGVDVAPRLTITHVAEPGKRQAGVKVGSVDELVEKLKALGVAK